MIISCYNRPLAHHPLEQPQRPSLLTHAAPNTATTASYKAAVPNLLKIIPLSIETLRKAEMGPGHAIELFYQVMKSVIVIASTPTHETAVHSNADLATTMAAQALAALAAFTDDHFDYFLRDERFFFGLNMLSDQMLFTLQKCHRSETIGFLRVTFEGCARTHAKKLPSSLTRLEPSQSAKNLNDFLSRLNPETQSQFRKFFQTVYITTAATTP